MLSFLDKIPYGTPKIRRIVFWMLTALICYTLIGFFVVPPVLKSVAQSQLTENLKRTSTIEKVYFNPFTLRLEITNLKIAKKSGTGEMVSVGQITAAPGPSSIWEFAPVISYLTIADLTVDVTFYGEGSYSFSDLMGTPDAATDEKAKEADDTAVFPFALYGFELTNATIIFDDKPHNKKHVISEMNLRVPFTSSIEDKQKEFTQPKFTAVVNGDPVELNGRTLPFDKTLLTEFQLGAVDINLDQYWKYVPVKTNLELAKGRFTSNISLYFERPDAQRMKLYLGGGGKLKNVELVDPMEGSVFSLKELDFEMERFSLGDNALILTSVTLDSPYFRVIRNKDNTINWASYFPASKMDPEGTKVKTEADNNAAFVVSVKKSAIKNGELLWADRTIPGGFQRILKDFTFEGSELSTEQGKSSEFNVSIGNEGIFSAKGVASMDPMTANITVSAAHVPLHAYEPYLTQYQPLLVDSGLADFSAVLDFKMVDGTPDVNVTEGSIALTDFAARKPDAKDPSLAFKTFAISNAAVTLNEKNVTVDEIRLTGPMARVIREKDGQFDLQRLLASHEPPQQATEAATDSVADSDTTQAEAPAAKKATSDNWSGDWSAAVKQVIIEAGDFSMRDNALKIPGSVGVKNFKLTVKDMTTKKGDTLSYDLGGVWSGRGTFGLGGTLSVEPLWTKGRLRLNGLGLKPLDNYIAEQADAIIGKGVAYANLQYSFKNSDKPEFSVTGDTAIHSLAVKDTHTDEEIVSFDKFTVSSLSLTNEPYRLKIGEVALEKPHAVVEKLENGQLNFQRVMRMEPPAEPPADGEEVAKAKKEAVEEKTAQPAANEEELPKPEVEEPFFDTLEVDKVSITNGAVEYRDNTVHPSFATSLDDMNMSLTDINQTPEAKPQIDFKGNIQGTPMSVTGALNPAVTPLYSDLTISVNGMGLIPVTPYTLEYLAYPIQKGRLYADVKFKTEDWVLSADNKFFIEQLTLGKKDTRPDAPDVPVQFGLSLLQDSDGNMEINLPIRGRLDDPDFRIGGIVFKAIVSLLFKALSSPFTLIGSMFGGGEDMDFVVFEPGRSKLDQSGTEKLDTVIKALSERDRLSLEVDGVVAPTTDTTGLIQVKFERKVKRMKYESLSRDEQAATSVEAVTFDSNEEYADWLYEAYADEPDEEGVKPTTLFVTDRQPPEVMEKFIRERIVITEDDLHDLAMERAQTVRDYIVAANPALAERVFILDKEDEAGKTGVPAHRADLGLE